VKENLKKHGLFATSGSKREFGLSKNELGPREKFFSIDEFGPFAVKIQGVGAWCRRVM